MIALKPDSDRGLNRELHVEPRVNIRRFVGGASGGFTVSLLLSLWRGARGSARLRRHKGFEMIGSNGPATPREADRHESSRRNTRYWHPTAGREGGQAAVLSRQEECVFERNKMQRDLHTNERKEWEEGK